MFALPPVDAPVLLDVPVLVAQQTNSAKVPVYGRCLPVVYWEPKRESYLPDVPNGLSPAGALSNAGAFKTLFKGFTRDQEIALLRSAKETVIVQSQTGSVEFFKDPLAPSVEPYWVYVTKPNHMGLDRMAMQVEIAGKVFRLEYFIKIIETFHDGGPDEKRECAAKPNPIPKLWWRISETDTDASQLVAWQTQSSLSARLAAAEPVVHVAQSKTGKERFDVVMDTCQRATRGEVKQLHPLFHIGTYYLKLDVNNPKGIDYLTDAKLSIVTPPKHGSLTLKTSPVYGDQYYVYQAFDNTWLGKDRTEIRVELRGKTYKMIHRIEMTVDEELSDKPYEKYYNGPCDARGRRIAFDSEVSYPLTAGASTTDYSIGQLVTLLDLHHGLADAAGTLLVFEDLPGSALGLHEGGSGWNARITLDSNAAGHGWYVDATPWSVNDDYLPTSDPNLWLAKPGSGAEGKMDMLSVWLQEQGLTTPQRWRAVW